VPTTSPSSKDRRRPVGQRVIRPSQVGAAARLPVEPGRAPTPDEVAAITAAVFASPLVAWLPPRALRIVGIRISTGSPDWAFAALCPDGVDPAVIVLRWDVSRGWILDQVGTADVGTGLAPLAVLEEFRR